MPLGLWIWLVLVEAPRALARHKVRSGLAILGIVVAVATVIVVVALGRAGVQQAQSALESLGTNLVWVEAGSRTVGGVRTGSLGMLNLTPADAQAIRDEIRTVALVSEQVDGNIMVIHGDQNWRTRFRGVAPSYRVIKRWEVARGQFFDDEAVERALRVVVIGETVRKQLFGEETGIGETVRIQDALFEVIGVLEAKGASFTGNDQDDTMLLPWTAARAYVLGKGRTWLADILCSATSQEDIRKAGEQITALLRDRHHIAENADSDFNIRHPEDALQAQIRSRKTLERLFVIIASISMLVGGIGVMNVMLASVSQRITEIGLRGAVGATPSAIGLQFLAEAMLLTTAGGALGVLAGEITASLLERHLGWTLAMSRQLDVVTVLAALGVGVVFGYYPAARAARMDPITALRRD